MASAVKTKVQQMISEQSVVVFSKSWCGFSRATKQLLSELGVTPYILELDQIDEGAAVQDVLADMTGQKTVPNVFIGGKHIGGNSDVMAKNKSGELTKLLKAANAI